MKKYSNNLILEHVRKRKLTTRGLESYINQANPTRKAMSHTTCARMLDPNYDPKVSYIEAFARAFKFSPRSLFVDEVEE